MRIAALDDLSITLDGVVPAVRLRERLRDVDPDRVAPVDARRLDDLKFAVCLPEEVGLRVLELRDRNRTAVEAVRAEPVESAGAAKGSAQGS